MEATLLSGFGSVAKLWLALDVSELSGRPGMEGVNLARGGNLDSLPSSTLPPPPANQDRHHPPPSWSKGAGPLGGLSSRSPADQLPKMAQTWVQNGDGDLVNSDAQLSHNRKPSKRMASLTEMKEVFHNADAVCFDVDSTVIREEGIDELAKFCGVGDAVAEMTRRAMGGSVTFKAALTARLGLIRPSYEQVQKLISEHPPQLTPGIRELVNRLHQRGVQVFLVSGGFQSIVEHVASQLNIPVSNVYANRLKFYFNGEYAGFDETQPTAESGGKGQVISYLKEQFQFKKVVMIGDGATDMEACPPADCFIGFGGNVVRKQVKEKAKWYITHFDELLKELEER